MIRRLKNFYHLLVAILANVICRFPTKNLTVIGVTGTDGKTTTTHLIHHILKKSNLKADLISSVSAPGLHTTTPDPFVLQRLLRKMVDQGIKYVVLEVTSHGLDQHRLFGIKFLIGVVTNVTHEHLDYHKTYENYLKAKAKLFEKVKIAVLNRDDASYQYLSSIINHQSSNIITYGIKNKADFTPKIFKFKPPLPGKYNQYNCLAAIAATSSLNIPAEKIRKAVASFKSVKGRMEEIKEGQEFEVIVDFAHTPNALKNVLEYLGKKKKKRLIVVFGCAGLRDKKKRPMMGEIAAKYADLIILTAEDPRIEDVNEIIEQIATGCLRGGAKEAKLSHYNRRDYTSRQAQYNNIYYHSKNPCFFRVPDRREAIKLAIQKLAKKEDIVVICGKGHEKSMCFGKTEYPWSDHKEARKALKQLNA